MLILNVRSFEETPLPLVPQTQATTKAYQGCLPVPWTPTPCGFFMLGTYHTILSFFFFKIFLDVDLF